MSSVRYGHAASKRVIGFREFVAKRDVRCDSSKYDTVYRNRRIGMCRVDGEDMSLNQWLVREGWALTFEPYAKGRFKGDEEEARSKGKGLWKGCFVRPQAARPGNERHGQLAGISVQPAQERQIREMLFPAIPAMPSGCSIKGKFAARRRSPVIVASTISKNAAAMAEPEAQTVGFAQKMRRRRRASARHSLVEDVTTNSSCCGSEAGISLGLYHRDGIADLDHDRLTH